MVANDVRLVGGVRRAAVVGQTETAAIVQAPAARRIVVAQLRPGIHAMTNLDLDDDDDPRIRFVHEHLEPEQFVGSAGRICRDERIVITGAGRGTVSSSLILVGGDLRVFHIIGDPRDREYDVFRPFCR